MSTSPNKWITVGHSHASIERRVGILAHSPHTPIIAPRAVTFDAPHRQPALRSLLAMQTTSSSPNGQRRVVFAPRNLASTFAEIPVISTSVVFGGAPATPVTVPAIQAQARVHLVAAAGGRHMTRVQPLHNRTDVVRRNLMATTFGDLPVDDPIESDDEEVVEIASAEAEVQTEEHEYDGLDMDYHSLGHPTEDDIPNGQTEYNIDAYARWVGSAALATAPGNLQSPDMDDAEDQDFGREPNAEQELAYLARATQVEEAQPAHTPNVIALIHRLKQTTIARANVPPVRVTPINDAGPQCVLCESSAALYAAIPCGHLSLCPECHQDNATTLVNCPFCSNPVQFFTRIFF